MAGMLSEGLVAEGMRFAAGNATTVLADLPMLAVRMEDGRIGYCVVEWDEENGDEPPYLSLYMDGMAILSYMRVMRAMEGDSPVQAHQAFAREAFARCVLVEEASISHRDAKPLIAHGHALDGQALLPTFWQKRMFYVEEALADEALDGYLRQALRAATFAGGSEQVWAWDEDSHAIPLLTYTPFGREAYQVTHAPPPDDIQVEMSGLALDDEGILAMARKKAMPGEADMYCELVAAPKPKKAGGEEYWPVGLLAAVPNNQWLMLPFVEHLQEGMEALLSELLDALLERGLPRRVFIRDEITSMLLNALWGQLGVPVEDTLDIPLLDEAIEVYYERETGSVRKG